MHKYKYINIYKSKNAKGVKVKVTLKKQANKILIKFIASMLVVLLSCTNFLVCGNYLVTYAAEKDTNLDKQTEATLHKNVKFDAYFGDSENTTHYKIADLNNEEAKLSISIHVQKEGYLKNASIDLKNENGENELNFTVTDLEDSNAIVQSASENQLVLRQVNSGDKIEFKAKLAPKINENINIEKLNSNSKIVLKGLYIDGNGKETPIEKEIEINLGWEGKYEANIKQSLLKYIPIEQENDKRTLVSMQIETGLKEQKYMLPIKETNLEVEVPIINGEKPNLVTVNAISTLATNGLTSENMVFTEENWEYNDSEGKININVKNDSGNLGKETDIYVINYIYSENVCETLEKGEVEIETKAKVQIKTYSNSGLEETVAETNDKISLSEPVGKLISMLGENITETISKGKIYANINDPQSNDNTEYEYRWNINIAYLAGLKGLILQNKEERMIDENNNIGDLSGKTIYKQLTFNSESFDELLGEEGKVSIYNKEGMLLALVAKDSRTDKNGNYIVEFTDEITDITIETSKPLKSGNLSINIKKEIKSNLGFTKKQIDNFKQIDIISEISQIEEKTNEKVMVEQKTVSIPLEQTVTKSKISINKEKLSTLVKNENVEITIELGNDNENSDLYIDPIFEIELPEAIENVEILESRLLFDEELLINKVEFVQKDGKPMIRVMLEGVQTKFSNGVVTNGSNIVLKTNITVNRFSPSSTEEIKMYYYNSNALEYDNGVKTDKGVAGLATTNIDFVAPTGMITINGMTNYDGTGDTILTLNQGEILSQVETYKPARIIKMNLMAINNTGNTCTDVVMLGRIPFAGNKDIETNEDLGTTMDTYLRGYIVPENLEGDGIKIYYSENGEATSNLGETENAWTETPTDLSKIKSYMIVLEGYEMQQGEVINFTYDFEYPSNIGYNQTINSNYGIYYVNNTQVATVSSFAKSDKIGITTGKGPELQISQKVDGVNENGTVESYKVLKYTISVTNTGTEMATDVNIRNEIPKWTCLVRPVDLDKQVNITNVEVYANQEKNKEIFEEWNVVNDSIGSFMEPPVVNWNIPVLEPGATVQSDIYVLTMNSPDIYSYYKDYQGFTVGEDGKYYISTSVYDAETDTSYEQKNEITSVPEIDVKNVTLVDASNINAVLKASTDEVTVKDTDSILVEDVITAISGKAMEKEQITFTISIENPGDLRKIKIEKELPEIFKYVSSELTITDMDTSEYTTVKGTYDESTRKIVIEESGLKENVEFGVVIVVKVNKLNEQEYSREISTNTKITYNNIDERETDDVKLNIVKPKYKVTQECTNTSSRINTGDEIEYTLYVENVGDIPINGLNLLTYVPTGFFVDKVSSTQDGTTVVTHSKESGEDIDDEMYIPVGGNVIIKMKFKVMAVKEDTTTMLYSQFYGDSVETTTTDMIIQTIEQDKKYKGQNGSTSNGGNNSNGENNNTNNNVTEKTYKISGIAWLDDNENGQKDEEDITLEGITVRAIDSETGKLATDTLTGEVVQAVTDKDGKYLLTNVKPGKYLIVFNYDSNVYTTTTYQKQNVSELYNSNVIEKQITIGEETTIAGVSNVINVEATILNLNIGLISKAKFDLKLEKNVTKITVQNGEGTKIYNFNNEKLAKVEIPSKQLAKSIVIIEYTIKVTNEGNVAGYAKNIVDYKASDLSFNSSLNPNWYSGNDGNIYTTILENDIIKPGETKEVKILLTKQMNENNVGMSNNVAEIQEHYNEQGLKDKDSTPGNNSQGEDDRGLADVIITVKTGEKVKYIIITIIIFIILAIGIVFIKRINKRKDKEVYK